MRSFIIHMRGDTRRQANAEHLRSVLPDAQIADAVRGSDAVKARKITSRPGDLFKPHYPFALSAGEIGCFLSHRACWQRIIDEDLEHALIVEDDLCVDPDLWPAVLAILEAHAGIRTFIRIPAKQRETAAAELVRQGPLRLILPRVIGLQTICQIVGRDAARRLLAASETLDRPVDTFLQLHWRTGQPVQSLLGSGIRELTGELGGSTIQKKTRTSGKLAREIRRAWYRAQINLRPQRP